MGLGSSSAIASTPSSKYYCSFEVIGYYPDYWQIPIPDIRYDKFTHLVFFSIYPNPDGSINTSQIDGSRQSDFITSAHEENTDVLICAGGWNLSENFGPVTANPQTRTALINHLKQYCIDHGFKGAVLDWEPVSSETDRDHYTQFIQELKTAFSPSNLSLSVAVSALGSEFNPSAVNDIDRLHIMAYDMQTDASLPHSAYEGALSAINHWETFGFPRSKMILGLPFYGRDADGGYHAYKEIIRQYAPGPELDEINGINFNGIQTIKAKTRYTVENHYRGVMCWELMQDTMDPTSLLTALSDEIHLIAPPDFNCDQAIDALDLEHLVTCWLRTGCQTENAWCDAADLDHSNAVNLQDFTVFAHHWIDSE